MYRSLLLCSNSRLACSPALTKTIRRTLFSFPGFPSSKGELQRYQERKVLPYSQEQLYNVVSDVESYPHFVPFCTASHITKPLTKQPGSNECVMEAQLTIGYFSFQESYGSKVTCVPFTSVQAEASSETPLFKALRTKWTFQSASSNTNSGLSGQPSRTLCTLDLVYGFANPLHATVSAAFFGQVSKQMVKAFEDRCHQVYRDLQ